MKTHELNNYRLAFRVSFEALKKRKVDQLIVRRLKQDSDDILSMAEKGESGRSIAVELERLLIDVRSLVKLGGELNSNTIRRDEKAQRDILRTGKKRRPDGEDSGS